MHKTYLSDFESISAQSGCHETQTYVFLDLCVQAIEKAFPGLSSAGPGRTILSDVTHIVQMRHHLVSPFAITAYVSSGF